MISNRASFHLFNSFFCSAFNTSSPKDGVCCPVMSYVLNHLLTSPSKPFGLSAGT